MDKGALQARGSNVIILYDISDLKAELKSELIRSLEKKSINERCASVYDT